MEANTRFTVDAAHCQRAEDELRAMLLRQDVAFASRWQSHPGFDVGFNIARAIGIFASLLGLVLTIAFLVLGSPAWAVPPNPWYLPVFGAGLVAFCLLPRIRPWLQASAQAWGRRLSENSCRRHAERLVRSARQFAPFDAHYEFNGSLLIYSRAKDSQKVMWRRDLLKYRDRGLALRGADVTAIFRRPGSFYPSVVILQDSSEWLTRVLQETGIATITADTTIDAAVSRDAIADVWRLNSPESEPQPPKTKFALEKNQRSLYAVITFFALCAFALLDGIVLNKLTLLNGRWIIDCAPFFGLLGIAAYPILARGGVPARESLTLSLLLGLALALAFVPLVKRADQWVAGDSTVSVVYELHGRGRFIPVNVDAPQIDYSQYPEYWARFEPGSSHAFQLIHGPFGLWQINEAHVRERLRAFYEKSP